MQAGACERRLLGAVSVVVVEMMVRFERLFG